MENIHLCAWQALEEIFVRDYTCESEQKQASERSMRNNDATLSAAVATSGLPNQSASQPASDGWN